MYRFIYKITCTQDIWKDHFYLGKHKTEDLNDGYKGSSVKLKYYYEKYPDDYTKDIICFCETDEELNQKEREIIGENIYNPLCLNLIEGGLGGIRYAHTLSDKTRKKISESLKEYFSKNGSPKKGKKMSEAQRQKLLDAWKTRSHNFSEDVRKKMSESKKGVGKSDEIRKHMSEAQRKRRAAEKTILNKYN